MSFLRDVIVLAGAAIQTGIADTRSNPNTTLTAGTFGQIRAMGDRCRAARRAVREQVRVLQAVLEVA